jgi:hypothetical protein
MCLRLEMGTNPTLKVCKRFFSSGFADLGMFTCFIGYFPARSCFTIYSNHLWLKQIISLFLLLLFLSLDWMPLEHVRFNLALVNHLVAPRLDKPIGPRPAGGQKQKAHPPYLSERCTGYRRKCVECPTYTKWYCTECEYTFMCNQTCYKEHLCKKNLHWHLDAVGMLVVYRRGILTQIRGCEDYVQVLTQKRIRPHPNAKTIDAMYSSCRFWKYIYAEVVCLEVEAWSSFYCSLAKTIVGIFASRPF